jgi:hypothetical protein
MSSYNATVELFSKLCFAQLSQPLSALDAANDGFGATLVPHHRTATAAPVCAHLLQCSQLFDAVIAGRHVRCVRGGQRLLLRDVEAHGRRLEIARVAAVRMVQRAVVYRQCGGAGDCGCGHSISLQFSENRKVF